MDTEYDVQYDQLFLVHHTNHTHSGRRIALHKLQTMALKRPAASMERCTVKKVELTPSGYHVVEFIQAIEGLLDEEYEKWAHRPGCRTRQNITNARAFLNSLKADLESENDFKRLVVAIAEIQRLKKLLTAIRCPRGVTAETKRTTLGKRQQVKDALVEIVRVIKAMTMGEDEGRLNKVGEAANIDINKFLEGQAQEIEQTAIEDLTYDPTHPEMDV